MHVPDWGQGLSLQPRPKPLTGMEPGPVSRSVDALSTEPAGQRSTFPFPCSRCSLRADTDVAAATVPLPFPRHRPPLSLCACAATFLIKALLLTMLLLLPELGLVG